MHGGGGGVLLKAKVQLFENSAVRNLMLTSQINKRERLKFPLNNCLSYSKKTDAVTITRRGLGKI